MTREKCVLIAVLRIVTILRLHTRSSYQLTATAQNPTFRILDMYWLAKYSNGMIFYLLLTLSISWLSCGFHRQQRILHYTVLTICFYSGDRLRSPWHRNLILISNVDKRQCVGFYRFKIKYVKNTLHSEPILEHNQWMEHRKTNNYLYMT